SFAAIVPRLHRVPVMTGPAQRVRKAVARVKPENVLPATDRLERIDGPARYVQRLLIKTEAAQVACHRGTGVESEQVVRAQDPAAILEVALVDLQSFTEASKPHIVARDVIPHIHGALMTDAESGFQIRHYAQVLLQRLA